MKKILLLIGMAVFMILLTESFGGDNTKYPSGSPGGYTGSPADGHHCVSCHGGSSANVTDWVTSDVPPGGYVGGTQYTITVTANGTGKKGFEISPQTTSGALVGTVAASSGTKLVNSNKAVTHSSSGSSSASTYSWSFPWTAPTAGTGPVTFFAAITVGKSNTKLTTLVIPESTGAGMEEEGIQQLKVYPNPAVDKINIDYALKTPSQVSISLYDISGRKVGEISSENSGNGTQHQLFILPDGLPHGMYFLNIKHSQSSTTVKILH